MTNQKALCYEITQPNGRVSASISDLFFTSGLSVWHFFFSVSESSIKVAVRKRIDNRSLRNALRYLRYWRRKIGHHAVSSYSYVHVRLSAYLMAIRVGDKTIWQTCFSCSILCAKYIRNIVEEGNTAL